MLYSEPPNELLRSDRWRSRLSEPSSVGILPTRKFCARLRLRRLRSSTIDGGMRPCEGRESRVEGGRATFDERRRRWWNEALRGARDAAAPTIHLWAHLELVALEIQRLEVGQLKHGTI